MSQSPGRADASFAACLRTAREAAALTQEELAQRAGLSTKAVGALERGERTRPYPHTVRALADALGLEGDERSRLVTAVPRRAATAPPLDSSPSEHDIPARVDGRRSPPMAASVLIGREDEVANVCGLVLSGRRVVTLTGPGGVGKTRLAVEVARRLAPSFEGGSHVVELAALRDPNLVVQRLAAALGLADPGSTTTAVVAAALAGRPVLVVLDNLEQVIACARDLATLVATCPDLVVLATSRAPLRIRAEYEVVVAPLAVPADGADWDAVASSPAVRMFIDRCAAAGNWMFVTPDTADVVAEICRRLDGIPLALELAAAGTRLLSSDELLARLGEVLDQEPLRDLPARQRTMTAVLDWSHELLGDDDRAVFERLAVFRGAFTLEAAAAVTDAPAAEAALGRLVEQSLVVRGSDRDGPPRLRLLEPVRQYATARLDRADRPLAVVDRHAAWFHGRAVKAFHRLRSPDLVACLDELGAEHADLRAAMLHLVDAGRTRDAAELLHGIWLALALRGHAREGRSSVDLLGSSEDDAARSMREVAAAGLVYATGDIVALRDHATAGLAAARSAGRDDLATEAAILAASGAAFAGDHRASRGLLDLAGRSAHAQANPWWHAHLRIAEAQLALLSAEPAAATAHLVVAEDLARHHDTMFTLATVLNLRATLTELAGDHTTSALLLAESTERSATGNLAWTLAYSLPALAAVAANLGEDVMAATLFGASASVAATTAVDTPFPAARALAEDGLGAVRQHLGDRAFKAAWDTGRVATRPDILALARSISRDVGD